MSYPTSHPWREAYHKKTKTNLYGIAFGVHGLITDEKVEVFNPAGHPPGGIVSNFGRFFHSYSTGYDKLWLLISRITKFGIPK
jgi:hypothetical protein